MATFILTWVLGFASAILYVIHDNKENNSMTKEQKEQRDKRDDASCKMFDNESELKNILIGVIEKYRNEGFTWAEIHFELFKLCNDICYDIEQKETKLVVFKY